ncbi:MAG: M20/M25/M40 family metallo-hydrolase [Gammaproteobacteria bacterium]|nr:M20/M25/M40 family metallo-hydrolase [Gammaproteobacteria bacterium]
MPHKWLSLSLVVLFSWTGILSADQTVLEPKTDPSIYQLIKKEFEDNFFAEESLVFLSDIYGPRLSGTPRYLEMVHWVESRLRSWGIDDIQLEVYGQGLRGWEVQSFSAAMTSPVFANLGAQPVCCSRSSNGLIDAVPEVVDFYDLDELLSRKGTLKGRVLLHPDVTPLIMAETGPWSDERLQAAAQRTNPVTPDGLDGPGSEETYVQRLNKQSSEPPGEGRKIAEFLISEGVAAVLRSSSAPAGMVNNRIDSSLVEFYSKDDPKPVPFFVIPREQHTRLLSLLKHGEQPKLELNLSTHYYEDPNFHVNLIAEIPGSDPTLKDEVVMLGAHLDSVETATGASDNAIGSIAAMELLRVLKALELKPRRTVRIALWGGEEQGLLGSSAYVEKHIGNIMTGEFFGEHEKISAYFNHDYNGHDVRGIFLVGHHRIKPIFKPIFAEFSDVGANTVSIENACCTDVVVFDATGIPSFEWIYDPQYYFTDQLHTDVDVPALVDIDSVKRNTAVVAAAVYATAMLDQRLPRDLQGGVNGPNPGQ